MMRCWGGCGLRWTDIQAWIRDYDNLQRLAVNLIYAQIASALIGSLGPLYNGVLLVNLVISLFALVAIESSSQSLARTYATLLFCSIFLDISWFVLFSRDIWNFPAKFYGSFVSYSVKLSLTMQIIGFSVRLSSSAVWIQMYRLGAAHVYNSDNRDADAYLRNSFLNPATPISRHTSRCDDEIVGGSIYDATRYSALIEDGRDETYMYGVSQNHSISISDSPAAVETSPLNPHAGKSFHVGDDKSVVKKLELI